MKKRLLLLCTVTLLNAEMITNSIGMTFVKIPEGSFKMGRITVDCPKDNPDTPRNENTICMKQLNKNETPLHEESVKAFYMATTEVTQQQYNKVMGNNPSDFNSTTLGYDSSNNPVENVSWDKAQKFIKKLNELEGTNVYYLPSETEWEYAARAGTTTKWSFGNDESKLDEYAWYGYNHAGKQTHPVGQKKPNPWGLYDMHGNVWEWTDTNYAQQYGQEDYKLADGTIPKVVRSGSWVNTADYSRSAKRGNLAPDAYDNNIGFRIARTLP
ncbi:formylglycine-generating enzyme family protein [Sulfurovum sp. zt1-1]|uniref:Formylglycine-generating enzyme family protein n=1 Tax=Sulfurovum zhangzhouensis TaxID=3019067 RepID=A0ABT7QVK1_9BACT|nr:formylglycine-generating enzyme family protein [Sulfurovum zhangzhouensis]MDM5270872.1 formylglycine-generating enzyme family protein [Sulfurovum zhangzhouensis]